MALERHTAGLATALIFLGLVHARVHAQTSPFDPAMESQAAAIEDRVIAFADRSLFICGEDIQFTAHVHTSGIPHEEEWSRILYVELLSGNGIQHARGKFRILNRRSSGKITIPAGLLTGTYVLRCYTRWMRNGDPSHYAYLPIKIINPYTPELSEIDPGIQGRVHLEPDPLAEGRVELLHMPTCRREDSVEVKLSMDHAPEGAVVHGSLSVVPRAAVSARPVKPAPGPEQENFKLDFLPDLQGLTLSGRVQEAGSRIHFTLLGEGGGYAMSQADAHGRFVLTLPLREGRMELLVQKESPDEVELEIRIDQDFDPRKMALELPDFSLSPEEEQVLVQMARKRELSGIYREKLTEEDGNDAAGSPPFYGSPDFRLDMDNYVLLPTLEEVLINLVPGVTPLTRRNRAELLIASDNPAISLFPPMIMIDQVPLFSMEKFLSVPTERIRYIDVIRDVYVNGDNRFGGLINLQSREGNMAGIDLPAGSFFIDFDALAHRAEGHQGSISPADQMPDLRNTVLWLPRVQLSGSAPLTLYLEAPDYPGEYVVVFRGLDEGGNLFSLESVLVVE